MNFNGYETKTTFWEDFSIADGFGKPAIIDTFKRAFRAWKKNVEYVTELVMVLNWKMWFYYEKGYVDFSKCYQKLYEQADCWCRDNLKGKDLNYFLKTTD